MALSFGASKQVNESLAQEKPGIGLGSQGELLAGYQARVEGGEREEGRNPPSVGSNVTAGGAARRSSDWREDVVVERVEVEAVVGGALQRVVLCGIEPHRVLEFLRGLDSGAEVRSEFMRKSFGRRETKRALVKVVQVRVTDSGTFIDLMCEGDGDEFTVNVSKKKSETWLDEVLGLGALSEKSSEKIRGAFETKGQALVLLGSGEEFSADYWETDDGKRFLDGMSVVSSKE